VWVYTGRIHHYAEGDLLAQRFVIIHDGLAVYVVPLTSRSMARIRRTQTIKMVAVKADANAKFDELDHDQNGGLQRCIWEHSY
jgi:hypothetical protein